MQTFVVTVTLDEESKIVLSISVADPRSHDDVGRAAKNCRCYCMDSVVDQFAVHNYKPVVDPSHAEMERLSSHYNVYVLLPNRIRYIICPSYICK